MNQYFEMLKSVFYLPKELKLEWIPDSQCKYRGYVSQDCSTIFIFDVDEADARETLLHEIIDMLVSGVAIRSRVEDIYPIKEGVVETLRKLIPVKEVEIEGSRREIIEELEKYGLVE